MRRGGAAASGAVAVLVASTAGLAACSSAGGGDWGPLAVVDDSDFTGGGSAALDGTLRIGTECVTVQAAEGGETTLVWPAGRTRWIPDREVIAFEAEDGSVDLRQGSVVFLGGGESTTEEFLSGPAEGCPEERFLVSDVQVSG